MLIYTIQAEQQSSFQANMDLIFRKERSEISNINKLINQYFSDDAYLNYELNINENVTVTFYPNLLNPQASINFIIFVKRILKSGKVKKLKLFKTYVQDKLLHDLIGFDAQITELDLFGPCIVDLSKIPESLKLINMTTIGCEYSFCVSDDTIISNCVINLLHQTRESLSIVDGQLCVVNRDHKDIPEGSVLRYVNMEIKNMTRRQIIDLYHYYVSLKLWLNSKTLCIIDDSYSSGFQKSEVYSSLSHMLYFYSDIDLAKVFNIRETRSKIWNEYVNQIKIPNDNVLDVVNLDILNINHVTCDINFNYYNDNYDHYDDTHEELVKLISYVVNISKLNKLSFELSYLNMFEFSKIKIADFKLKEMKENKEVKFVFTDSNICDTIIDNEISGDFVNKTDIYIKSCSESVIGYISMNQKYIKGILRKLENKIVVFSEIGTFGDMLDDIKLQYDSFVMYLMFHGMHLYPCCLRYLLKNDISYLISLWDDIEENSCLDGLMRDVIKFDGIDFHYFLNNYCTNDIDGLDKKNKMMMNFVKLVRSVCDTYAIILDFSNMYFLPGTRLDLFISKNTKVKSIIVKFNYRCNLIIDCACLFNMEITLYGLAGKSYENIHNVKMNNNEITIHQDGNVFKVYQNAIYDGNKESCSIANKKLYNKILCQYNMQRKDDGLQEVYEFNRTNIEDVKADLENQLKDIIDEAYMNVIKKAACYDNLDDFNDSKKYALDGASWQVYNIEQTGIAVDKFNVLYDLTRDEILVFKKSLYDELNAIVKAAEIKLGAWNKNGSWSAYQNEILDVHINRINVMRGSINVKSFMDLYDKNPMDFVLVHQRQLREQEKSRGVSVYIMFILMGCIFYILWSYFNC